MVESNFSFVRFVKYVLRYFWVAVLCVVIGVGACIPMVLKKDVVNYERYIGRITFDLTQYAALVKAEGISLSDDEKKNNFDRYVEKFVNDYGYGEEYVRENMSEQIYQTMLFDKTLERLITLNKFVSEDKK